MVIELVQCENCGSENTDDVIYCQKCGKILPDQEKLNAENKSQELTIGAIIAVLLIFLLFIKDIILKY
jgi:hypothetical protein